MSRSSASPGFWTTLRRNLNFFRVHLLFFIFTPLICSVILWASNGRFPIPYIDALYNSVSAVTVCGLATVNLSQLTPWQQFLLFFQMCVGSPVVISWFMVYIRRHFFAKKFEYILRAEAARRGAGPDGAQPRGSAESAGRGSTGRHTLGWRVTSLLRRRRTGLSPVVEEDVDRHASEDGSSSDVPREKERERETMRTKVRTDMIRRMDAPPRRVDPNGWISEEVTFPQLERLSSNVGSGQERGVGQSAGRSSSFVKESPMDGHAQPEDVQNPYVNLWDLPAGGTHVARDPHSATVPGNYQPPSAGLGLIDTNTLQMSQLEPSLTSAGFPRTTTIEFAPTVARRYVPLGTVPSIHNDPAQDSPGDVHHRGRLSRDPPYSGRYPGTGGQPQMSLTKNPSQHPSLSPINPLGEPGQGEARQTGFGGFPMPLTLLGMLFRRLFPGAANRLRRTVTIPATTALSGGELGRTASISGVTGNIPQDSKPVPYISFDAIVGRNSDFRMLTNEQLEELGGVEYRALNALLWLVALYHFGSQLIAFVVIAPYMALPRWASDFVPPALFRPVATPWFSLFQVVSTYTNTGLSLVDQSMLPFQTAYPMIFFMVFLILAGNTAFPIFLRFMIWTIAKLIPSRSRLYETLHFLLDHPRRCFIYLFPAHQTWFLLIILLLLNSIDYFCFMVLDIGIPEIEAIPLGTRFAAGLLQATDVRASGFTVVPVNALGPAVKVMYVIMMYISVYPIAMSVRSTNVYEEQSLGIFHTDDQSVKEHAFKTNGSRISMWGRYLAMHARYQLSFDMWWLALALFVVCIIERDNLINPELQGWFNIFNILFEIVSAYGSVGLSTGIPTQNYSLSGAFRPLSKFVLCLVMIRGRHRGLPVAIDRAIVLPYEFERGENDRDPPPRMGERRSSRYNTGTTSCPVVDDARAQHGDTIVEKEKEGVGNNEVGEDRAS